MPQQKQLTWAQLRVGAMVVVSLVIFAVAIFFISGQIGFLTPRYNLKTYFSDAGSLRDGAQVRLAGIAVGNVDHIGISPFSEPNRAVEVDMRVSKAYQKEIRANSTAAISTVGLLGESYVDLTRGSPSSPVLKNGAEVKSRESANIKEITQNTNDVISNLQVLTSNLNDITGEIRSGKGSIGMLIYDKSLYNRLNSTSLAMQKLVARLNQGQGTIGKLLTDDTLYQHAVNTVDHMDRVVGEMQHGNGTIAKLITDPSLYNNANKMVEHANTLVSNVNSGHGTLGKLATDPSLYNNLNASVGHLNTITSRIDKGEGTLGKLSTDPKLFNNLSDSSQSLKEFLDEFKKNPKKYLTLHLHIF